VPLRLRQEAPSCGAAGRRWTEPKSGFGLATSNCERLDVEVVATSPCKITHGNHPRRVSLIRTFQCLAVPQQPLKLLETLEIRVLKRLASAVQLRPWPPYFQSLNSTLNRHRRGCAEPRPEFSGVEQFFPFLRKIFRFHLDS
jgi:hypothetical protein